MSIEARQPVPCSQPDETIAILQHMVHHALRKALGHIIAHYFRLLGNGGERDQEEDGGEEADQSPER